MSSKLNPYIAFKGKAREAMEFYKTVFGGKLLMTTFGEANFAQDPSEANNIMHALLETDNEMTIMAADAPSRMDYKEGTNISISLSGEDDEELSGYFEKLSAGGKIQEPLVTAPWGDKFGMFTDKFGINWMVNISAKKG
jgi:PhnB protein